MSCCLQLAYWPHNLRKEKTKFNFSFSAVKILLYDHGVKFMLLHLKYRTTPKWFEGLMERRHHTCPPAFVLELYDKCTASSCTSWPELLSWLGEYVQFKPTNKSQELKHDLKRGLLSASVSCCAVASWSTVLRSCYAPLACKECTRWQDESLLTLITSLKLGVLPN